MGNGKELKGYEDVLKGGGEMSKGDRRSLIAVTRR